MSRSPLSLLTDPTIIAADARLSCYDSGYALAKGETMKLNGAVIPDEIVRRVIARRGGEHCFA